MTVSEFTIISRDEPKQDLEYLCCCCSVAQLYPTLCNPMEHARLPPLSFIVFQGLLKLMSIESVMPSNHLILYCPLLFLPSIFPSIGIFSSELTLLIGWPKYWSFSFSISSSNDYSGLISFGTDWFYLLGISVSTIK